MAALNDSNFDFFFLLCSITIHSDIKLNLRFLGTYV